MSGASVLLPTPTTTGKKPVSLREVMDEEYARKIQQEEAPVQESVEEDLDEDLRLALELSKQDAEILDAANGKQEVSTAEQKTVDQLDTDFALALQLQNEADEERRARRIQEEELLRTTPQYSKVSYTLDPDLYKSGSFFEAFASEYQEAYPQEFDDEEEDEEDEDEDLAELLDPSKAKPYHETTKVNGRQVITKHDPVVSGIRNSESAEQNLDSGNLQNVLLFNPVYNSLKEGNRRQETHRIRARSDKLDKSTNEQVMDQRTRVMLLKLMNTDVLSEIHGILSTGKEANVYHALAGDAAYVDEEETVKAPKNKEYAIKIYKTTLNEFKNRTDYIEGEYRFRFKTKGLNARKLIKLWAEKEMRNLKRLQNAGVACPDPIFLRENILIMGFIGNEGLGAPTLKDASLSADRLLECYVQCIKMMRVMYQRCRLVHADLSEFNMLYHKRQLYFIDVSQSVEYDHPKALDFLRKDCTCVTNFFRKKGVQNVLSLRQLFDFVTHVNIPVGKEDEYIEKSMEINETKGDELTNEEQIEEGVFKQSFIPRTLNQVQNPTGELFDQQPSFHQTVTGLKEDSVLQNKQ